jgi:hypothetical protein
MRILTILAKPPRRWRNRDQEEMLMNTRKSIRAISIFTHLPDAHGNHK